CVSSSASNRGACFDSGIAARRRSSVSGSSVRATTTRFTRERLGSKPWRSALPVTYEATNSPPSAARTGASQARAAASSSAGAAWGARDSTEGFTRGTLRSRSVAVKRGHRLVEHPHKLVEWHAEEVGHAARGSEPVALVEARRPRERQRRVEAETRAAGAP